MGCLHSEWWNGGAELYVACFFHVFDVSLLDTSLLATRADNSPRLYEVAHKD